MWNYWLYNFQRISYVFSLYWTNDDCEMHKYTISCIAKMKKKIFVGFLQNVPSLGTVFDEILTSIYLEIAFIFGLQTLQSIDLGRIYCLKSLEPKNKGYFQIDGS